MQQIRALLMLAFHTTTKTKPSRQSSQVRQTLDARSSATMVRCCFCPLTKPLSVGQQVHVTFDLRACVLHTRVSLACTYVETQAVCMRWPRLRPCHTPNQDCVHTTTTDYVLVRPRLATR